MTDEEKKAAEDKAKADAADFAAMKAKADAYDELKAKADAEELEKKAKADADDEEAKAKKEAEDADDKAKADAAKFDAAVEAKLAARLKDIEARLPKAVSDADYAGMAEAQARADSVAHAFGESAPRPLDGEDLMAYRKRLAAKFQGHSASWKSANLSAISDAAVLEIAEKAIYADAMTAANSPVAAAGGGLREVISRSRAGHEISNFVGRISDFTGQFKPPVRKFVQGFTKPSA